MPRRVCIIATTAWLAACSSHTTEPFGWIGAQTLPDPGGCFVLVYDRAQFMGARDFINGPRKYPTLTDLPFRANWRHRIRSVEIGPRASVTMWADALFRGTSQTFSPSTKHPLLSDALDGEVESVDVICPPPGRSDP